MIRSRTAATAALAMLALAPIASAVGILDFEDLTPNDSWSGGQSFVTDAVTVNVLSEGDFSGGSVQVEDSNSAGAGQGLFVEEVILLFDFDFPFTDAWFDYAVFGGDLAVVVNGNIYTGANPIDLEGVYPGGISIDVVEDIKGFTGSVHDPRPGADARTTRSHPHPALTQGSMTMPRTSTTAVATALASLALAPLASADGTVDFDDLTPGTSYSDGESFVSNGVTIDAFDRTNFSGGSALVSAPSDAGAINGMFIENVALEFHLPFPVTSIQFNFAEYGGNVFLSANNAQTAVTSFSVLDGVTLGGVDIQVFGAARLAPTVILTGNITQFAFGLEDGEIDNVYYIPTPAAAPLLALGALGVTRRRRH